MRRVKSESAEPPPKAVKPPVPTRTVAKFIPPWISGQPGPVAGLVVEEIKTEAYDFRHVHPKTQAIRRMFVAEFVKDFNGAAAIARLGFEMEQPHATAMRWLKEPFTQHVLDKYIRESEDAALVTRQQVIAALNREANNYGLDSSGASRVSALGKLAKILGMEIDRSQVDVRVAGGIMLIPLAATPSDWEKNASRAQLELKADAVK